MITKKILHLPKIIFLLILRLYHCQNIDIHKTNLTKVENKTQSLFFSYGEKIKAAWSNSEFKETDELISKIPKVFVLLIN